VILATVLIRRRLLHPSFSASILTRDCQKSILRLSAVPQASRHRLELPRSAPGPSWNLSGLPWTWPVHATVPCAGTAPAHGGEDHVHQDGRQHIDPGTVWGRWPPVQRCRVANLLPLCTPPLRPDDCLRCLPDTRSLSAESPRFDVDFRRLSISDASGPFDRPSASAGSLRSRLLFAVLTGRSLQAHAWPGSPLFRALS
jgi:hypothetical protein